MSGVPQEDRGRGACEGTRAECVHAPQGGARWAWSARCEQGIAVRKLGRDEDNAELLGTGGSREGAGWSRPVLEAGRHLVYLKRLARRQRGLGRRSDSSDRN